MSTSVSKKQVRENHGTRRATTGTIPPDAPAGQRRHGQVYLAEDARIGQQVAIKVSRTETASYPHSGSAGDAVRLFQREAKAIARLDHPRILPLYNYGEELVNGKPLRAPLNMPHYAIWKH